MGPLGKPTLAIAFVILGMTQALMAGERFDPAVRHASPTAASGWLLEHDPVDIVAVAHAMQAREQAAQQPANANRCQQCDEEEEDEESLYTIGFQRVGLATFEVEPAGTLGKKTATRVRLEGAYSINNPARLEYIWSLPQEYGGKGPPRRDANVDYHDLRLGMIVSAPVFQLTTEFGFRSIDPSLNDDSIGIGDMNIQLKTNFKNDDNLKISHLFITYLPTGYFRRGMGAGHVSMENDLLISYRISPSLWAHGQFGYWFGIGVDPRVNGQMIRSGLAFSKILYDHKYEDRAIIGTAEFVGWTITDGFEPVFNPDLTDTTLTLLDLDPETIFNFSPGLRFIFGENLEVGVNAGIALTTPRWAHHSFRIEVRMIY